MSNAKTYQIENQDYAGLAEHAAQAVKMTGSLTGNSIKVSRIVGADTRKGQ